MSLKLWLPLNGNLDNQGLSDIIGSSKGNITWAPGKIGKCLLTGEEPGTEQGVFYNSNLTTELGDEFSAAIWVCPKGNHVHYNGAFMSSGDWNGICWSFGVSQDNTQVDVFGTGYNHYIDCSVPINTWTHLTCTHSKGITKLYKNGIYVGQLTGEIDGLNSDAPNLCIGRETYLNGYFSFNGYINDVRVYDHCLSPKEVKEISKGLMLHYPLSSPYDIGFANKYSGATAEGKAQESALTVSKLEDERGYNYKMSYTGTGGNHWKHIYFPNFEFTPNKTYQYSCKVRLNKYSHSAIYFEMRGARINNDWSRPSAYSFNNIPMDGQWHTLSIAVTVPATFDLSGTTKTASPLVEFWTNSLSTSGTVYEMDFDLKDVQVVECDGPVEFIENEFLDSTIYDTSGYKNNGVPTNLKLSGDSPRRANSYIFDGTTSGIKLYPGSINLILAQGGNNSFTYSFWIKNMATDRGIIFGDHIDTVSKAFVSIEKHLQNELRFYWNNGYVDWFCTNTTLPLNIWIHIVITYNGSKLSVYRNGILTDSKAITLDTGNKTSDNCFQIGRDSRTDSTMFEGNISDFRIYATCLSDSDIQELYNKPISIDNQGMMFAVEAVEESATEPQFNKTGVVEATAINTLPLYDMETKVLDDGSAWARILHHNNRAGTVLFTASNVLDIQTADLYSRLKILEQFRDDNNAFEFMVIQPDIDDTIYRWKQANNPTKSGSLSGYVNIENTYNGLVYGPNGYALMSEGGVTSNWWCAVGAQQPYNGGIPGFGRNTVTGILDFYVRIDTVSSNKEFKLYNKYIECSDIIES